MNYTHLSKDKPKVIGAIKEASVLILIKKKKIKEKAVCKNEVSNIENNKENKDEIKGLEKESIKINNREILSKNFKIQKDMEYEDQKNLLSNRIMEESFKEEVFNIDIENDEIILEKRSSKLKSQPGDISLPGGKIEEGEDISYTALRETNEEIGIDIKDIFLIGQMNYVVTPYKNVVYPFIGVTYSEEFKKSKDEVEQILTFKLKDLLDINPKVYGVSLKQIPDDDFPYDKIVGGKKYPFKGADNPQYFYSIGNTHIWGLTALILKEFLDSVKEIMGKRK